MPHSAPLPHLQATLHGKAAPRRARAIVGAMIEAAGGDPPAAERIVLMISEVVTNALRAADGCTLAARLLGDGDAIRIEVFDASPELPRLLPVDPSRIGGHGLRIVDTLSDRWGVTPHETGKTVWLEARLHAAAGH